MPKPLEKNTGVSESENGKLPTATADDWEETETNEDDDGVLDKARQEVISSLPDKKKRETKEKLWRERPAHLRKAIGEMTAGEKRDFYLWQADRLSPKKEKEAEAPAPVEPERELYTPTMVKRTGKMILKFLARRMPVKKEVSQEEIDSFGEIFTPLANKYLGGVGGYQDELAGGMFLLAFFGERIGNESAQ